MSENRDQIVAQCKVVAHLARALAQVNEDYATIFAGGSAETILNRVGQRAAAHMELLGDIINGMDAVTDEDKWMDPIFEAAHRLYPNAAKKQGWHGPEITHERK
jgi:hypothetical protein